MSTEKATVLEIGPGARSGDPTIDVSHRPDHSLSRTRTSSSHSVTVTNGLRGLKSETLVTTLKVLSHKSKTLLGYRPIH